MLEGDDGVALRIAQDLDAAIGEGLEHTAGCFGVGLLARMIAPGLVRADLILTDAIERAQHFFAMDGGVIKDFERQLLVINDVAQMPYAAEPGLKVIPASLARVVAESVGGDWSGVMVMGVASFALADSVRMRKPPWKAW